jgi:hypothetical protein
MTISNNPELINIGVYIYQGKAYIPTIAQYVSGIFVDIDPIHLSSIDSQSLTLSMRLAKKAGHKQLPDPKSREEFLARGDPVLAATKARSWKQLARSGVAYNITWVSEHVRIEMTLLNKKGVWEFDPSKTKILPPDTPMERIAEIILEDFHSRSEVS